MISFTFHESPERKRSDVTVKSDPKRSFDEIQKSKRISTNSSNYNSNEETFQRQRSISFNRQVNQNAYEHSINNRATLDMENHKPTTYQELRDVITIQENFKVL